MIAHVGGVPVEEFLPALAGTGTGLVVMGAGLMRRLRRRAGAREMNATQTLHIERTFQAPVEAVFDAWTSRGGAPALVARRARLGDRPRPKSICAWAVSCGW